jgi:hypothetical protein
VKQEKEVSLNLPYRNFRDDPQRDPCKKHGMQLLHPSFEKGIVGSGDRDPRYTTGENLYFFSSCQDYLEEDRKDDH